MLVQISSGTGPIECEMAVKKLYESLLGEYPSAMFSLVRKTPSKYTDGAKSILFETDTDLSGLAGTVQWIWKTTVRPGHKRRNWFVDVSVIPEAGELSLDSRALEMEFFHCSGSGGQNVNKVETGVRLRHLPTGLVTESSSHRTQWQNRKEALSRMEKLFADMRDAAVAGQKSVAWEAHNSLERGNPVRVYKGEKFERVR